jgi:renalase
MSAIAIIGSGIAGLACAQRLAQAGLAPVVFDKGRGLGGRCATRRMDTMQFDHGAQYVTARGDAFAAVLAGQVAAGNLAPWPDSERFVGVPGMSALARALGAGLEIRQGQQVTALVPTDGGWLVRIGAEEHRFARVVVTVPAPQVAALLGDDHPLVARIAGVAFAPCLTLMATITGDAPFTHRADADDAIAWIAQDSSKPGRPQAEATCWVAQAGERFSHEHLETDPAAIADLMTPMLCERLGVSPSQVRHATAHRWRYARVSAPFGAPFVRAEDGRLYLGGDWCLGARIEDAWTSGTAIAEDLLRRA